MTSGDTSVIVLSDEEDDGLSPEEKKTMIQKFIDLTKTNEETANIHLEDSNWNVQKAVSNYYVDLELEQRKSDDEDEPSPVEHNFIKKESQNGTVVISDDENEENNEVEMTADDEESEDEDAKFLKSLPPIEVCNQLVAQFVEVTGTDPALAQFYLQDRDWNAEKSINDFFMDLAERNSTPGSSTAPVVTSGVTSSGVRTPASVAPSSSVVSSTKDPQVQPINNNVITHISKGPPPVPDDDILKVITWNIDGLDPKNIELRTQSVCQTIIQSQADVAMLQEVVPLTLTIIESLLSSRFHLINSGVEDYFTAVLISKQRFKLGDFNVHPFKTSSMGRKLQVVEASFKSNHSIFFLNTHLESTAEFGVIREQQLTKCFQTILKIPEEHSVIFGGDLNLRDKELDAVGGIPDGVVDLWEANGRRAEAKFTWDMTRNDNLVWNHKFKPRCRFDRLYFRGAKEHTELKPEYFGLIGIERLLPHRCFPSDHWGLFTLFRLIKKY